MKKTRIINENIKSKQPQDKTDWNKVYSKPQNVVDREARIDSENPVLKDARFRRLKK